MQTYTQALNMISIRARHKSILSNTE